MNTKWPKVRLGEVVEDLSVARTFNVQADSDITNPTIHSATHTITNAGTTQGINIKVTKRIRIEPGDLVFSRLHTQNGAFAYSEKYFQATGTFIPLRVKTNLMDRRFLYWTLHKFIPLLSASDTVGRETFKTNEILALVIPCPPIGEQRRIVERIEETSEEIDRVKKIRIEVQEELQKLLMSAYHRIANNAPRVPVADVAPLNRRPVSVDPSKEYQQVAVRSFGRGTFHPQPLVGREVTWQRPYEVKKGDILVSNIKAWEGAIAVVDLADDGRVVSHRYLTYVPIPGLATARFLCFHLLTPAGLRDVGQASPGSADRNRTLNTKNLAKILVPKPPLHKQKWFDDIINQVEASRSLQSSVTQEIDALLPSILDRAFKGEL